MKKIAYLKFDYLPLSEVFIYEQLKNIKQFEIILLCTELMNLDKFPLENIRSLSYLPLHSYLINGVFLKFTKYCPYFAKIIESEKVSLIHASFGPYGVHGLSYKKKFDIPLITDFRGHDVYRIPLKKSGIYKKLFKHGDIFLARSNNMKKDLISLGCPSDKIIVHHSSIDINKFKFREIKKVDNNEKIKILLVGRFTEKKGIPYAIKAFANVKKKHKNIEFTIIGDGPQRSEIEAIIKNLRVEKSIRLLGTLPHNQVIKEISNSHIFMLPSITASDGDKEGIPNVLMEAQAIGLPVISTYHAGIPELVIDGKTGYLVNERDVNALSEKLDYLIEHQDLWASFGRAGRKHVEKEFNIYKQTEKLENIYETVLETYS